MKKRYFIASILILVIFLGCAPKSPDEFDNEKELYEYGLKLFERRDYMDAAKFFETFKNKYPTSPFITEAEFKLGESHFKSREYIEAIYAFQNFKYLHPTNPKVPIAMHRIAMSYYKQIPNSIDRDQTNTVNCMNVLKELLARYPNFEDAKKASQTLTKCKRMIAERELYIANFYMNQKSYKAALGRLESIKSTYNFKDLQQEAIYKLAYSYHKLNDRDKTIENLNELLGMNPDDSFKRKANKLIAKIHDKEKEKE